MGITPPDIVQAYLQDHEFQQHCSSKACIHSSRPGPYQNPPGLIVGSNAIEIRTAADHQAVEALVASMSLQAPRLHMHRYWIEFFCLWVTKSLAASSSVLVKEVDDSALLATKPTKTTVQETTPTYGWSLPQPRATASPPLETAQLIDPEPLMPTPEPLLTQLIHEVQRHILIDEATIRQIYYALLDGHVIFPVPGGPVKTRAIASKLGDGKIESKTVESKHESTAPIGPRNLFWRHKGASGRENQTA